MTSRNSADCVRGAVALSRIPPRENRNVTMVSGPTAAALIGWRELVAAIYSDVRTAHDADAPAAWTALS